jgi:hypothetical protein
MNIFVKLLIIFISVFFVIEGISIFSSMYLSENSPKTISIFGIPTSCLRTYIDKDQNNISQNQSKILLTERFEGNPDCQPETKNVSKDEVINRIKNGKLYNLRGTEVR